jgi:histidinol phosphatase-like PHP family hydrolase
MKNNKKITTKQHFEIFKKEFMYWQETFGLVGWNFDFEHKKSERNKADCAPDLDGRFCVVTLSKTWEGGIEEVTNERVREVAKHEAVHVLLARLTTYARVRYISKKELDEAEEKLVVILTKLL